jgi:hypothetical protein
MADPLGGDPCIKELLCGLKGDKILKGISGVVSWSAKTRPNKATLIPVLNLSTGQSDDFTYLSAGELILLVGFHVLSRPT